jgi:lipopolysaccharide assembly protein A
MRFGLILLTLLFVVLGAVFGALNSESISFDFYLGSIHAPKGAAFLLALLVGWLSGGLIVYLALVLRLRRRVRGLARELKQRDHGGATVNPSASAQMASAQITSADHTT